MFTMIGANAHDVQIALIVMVGTVLSLGIVSLMAYLAYRQIGQPNAQADPATEPQR